jgi:hypothetical protein
MANEEAPLSPNRIATIVYTKDQLVNLFLYYKNTLTIHQSIKGIKEEDLPIIQPIVDVVLDLEHTTPCTRRKDSIISVILIHI